MTTEALTYRELADRLGVKLESARKTVLRKKWQKVPGNDGTVRVLVPLEYLQEHAVAASCDSDSTSPQPSPQIRELEVMIEGLRSIIEAERRRADAAEADRDRWHAFATRPWWKRLAG